MKNTVIAFLKDEDGQTSTEYILLVAIVALIVIKFGDQLKKRLEGLVGKVFDRADTSLGEFN
jgi:pilus assembly protein Flp/PilA